MEFGMVKEEGGRQQQILVNISEKVSYELQS